MRYNVNEDILISADPIDRILDESFDVVPAPCRIAKQQFLRDGGKLLSL